MSDDLLHRALRPTLRRLGELAGSVSEEVRPLLEKAGEHICDPGCLIFQIQREAGATDWHVQMLKREVGLTLGELLRLCRLDVILWLLRSSRLSVSQIARLVGYVDARAMRKFVRGACGFTPAEARRPLCRVRPEFRALGEELVSWYFCVRFHRGEVGAEELRRAFAYLKGRFGLS